MFAADLCWLLLWVVDGALTPAARQLEVTREAPAAFAIGRTAAVRYRWRLRARRAVRVEVRERLPDPLGGTNTPTRRFSVRPGAGFDETLDIQPMKRGIGEGGLND